MNIHPVLLYDGNCAFCQHWVEKWRKVTGFRLRYEPYQTALARHSQVTEEHCRDAVQLIMPDGSVLSGAHAVLKIFSLGGKYRRVLRFYEKAPFFARMSEWGYGLVAGNRSFLSKFYQLPQCRR